jgi:hypothetical protein
MKNGGNGMTMLGYGAGYSEEPLSARQVLGTIATLFEEGAFSIKDAPAMIATIRANKEEINISPEEIEKLERALKIKSDVCAARDAIVAFVSHAVVKFSALAGLSNLMTDKPKAINDMPAITGKPFDNRSR